MYEREIATQLSESIKKLPVLTLTGPRQSGKTTLVRNLFNDYDYVSLEDPDLRNTVINDPRAFLKTHQKNNLILDEIQRAPEITSYIQTIVDNPKNQQKFILTGSQSLLLIKTAGQSLVGRTRVFELLPFSIRELCKNNDQIELNKIMFYGGYPKIYDANLSPTKWHKDYFRLYIERDVRTITNFSNIDLFEKFIRLCAGRSGQLLNLSSLGTETGITQPTANSWLSALKSTYICFTLTPHYKNFNKRIIKTPKLYFYDTGLLCYLLGITSQEQLDFHPLRGNIFENFIISEFYKDKLNKDEEVRYYFWRDQKGHEIDLIEDFGTHLHPTEIKLSETFNNNFLKNIKYLNSLQNKVPKNISLTGDVIYAGAQEMKIDKTNIFNWKNFFLNTR